MLRKYPRLLLVWILILTCASTVCATSTASAGDKSFLWRIRSGKSTVHILGSIHALKKDFYPLDNTIEDAFNTSDILVVEVNINKVDPVAMQKTMLEGSLYNGGTSLQNKLSSKTYEQAKDKLQEYGLAIEQLNMFKPSFIAITLTAMELQKQGYDPEYGIDKYFIGKAENNKTILELETYDFQINFFNAFSDKEQELFLIYTLSDMDIIGTQIDDIIAAWLDGDAKKMESILTKSISERPELSPIYYKLIDKRNVDMTDKITQYLTTDDNYFVVVGAAHLIGNKGILEILKRRGYTIEQL